MKVRLDDDGQETSIPYVTGNSYYDSVTPANNNNGWGAIVGDNETLATSKTSKLGDADYYVISTTSTSFQVSTTDGGSALELMLYESKTAADAWPNHGSRVSVVFVTVVLEVFYFRPVVA